MAKDYFIMECEGHPIPGDVMTPGESDVDYFPAFDRWWYGVKNLLITTVGPTGGMEFHPGFPTETPWPQTVPENVIMEMDIAGVDMMCVIPERFEVTCDNTRPYVTNGMMVKWCEKYPDRFVMCPNFHPTNRELKKAIWEMEYYVKEKDCRCFKLYPPEEKCAINDERLYPFYEKAQELGLVMQVHTGMAFVYGGLTKNCIPLQLEDVCRDFYDLKIVAFHFGWPWHHQLNALANCYENLHIGVSWHNRAIYSRPMFFQHLLGEAILWAGVDKIIWGSDGTVDPPAVNCFRSFQFDEDLQKGWGYKALTEEDKAKIYGLNLARLLRIEPKKIALEPPK
jgi:predicted TIM-barrel fold metal-dependent hydrolase